MTGKLIRLLDLDQILDAMLPAVKEYGSQDFDEEEQLAFSLHQQRSYLDLKEWNYKQLYTI